MKSDEVSRLDLRGALWNEAGKRGALQAALTHLLDRFYTVAPNGTMLRQMSTDELERREQTARVSWGVDWPNVRAVIDARKALEEASVQRPCEVTERNDLTRGNSESSQHIKSGEER